MANRSIARRSTNKWSIDLISRYDRAELYEEFDSLMGYLTFVLHFVLLDRGMSPIDSSFNTATCLLLLATQIREYNMWLVPKISLLFYEIM